MVLVVISKRAKDAEYEEAPSVQDVTVTTECSSCIVGSEAHYLNLNLALISILMVSSRTNESAAESQPFSTATDWTEVSPFRTQQSSNNPQPI